MKNAFFHTQNAIIKGAELCASSSSSADVVSHIKYSLFARERECVGKVWGNATAGRGTLVAALCFLSTTFPHQTKKHQVDVKIHFAIINKNMTSVPYSANFMYKPASQQEVGTQNPISNLISGKRYLIKPCQSAAIHAEEITRRSQKQRVEAIKVK
jgi:hypothetical protein